MTEETLAIDVPPAARLSRWTGYIPLLVIGMMAVFLAIGLTMDPRGIPSPLIAQLQK